MYTRVEYIEGMRSAATGISFISYWGIEISSTTISPEVRSGVRQQVRVLKYLRVLEECPKNKRF